MLVVVIDTEEEFDWSAPLNPQSTSVRAMASVLKAQRIFDEYGIRPTYVIDHPVASQPAGSAPLQEIAASGRCEIGAHLHPWVNPPVEEPVNLYNSYACNLPAPLAREKLRRLGAAISATFGFPPRSYKAGRYGISAAMIPALKEEGYEVDLSTAPPFDYRGDGGPDFTRSQPDCYWLGGKNEMLEIPTTGAFVGWANGAAPAIRTGLYPFRGETADTGYTIQIGRRGPAPALAGRFYIGGAPQVDPVPGGPWSGSADVQLPQSLA